MAGKVLSKVRTKHSIKGPSRRKITGLRAHVAERSLRRGSPTFLGKLELLDRQLDSIQDVVTAAIRETSEDRSCKLDAILSLLAGMQSEQAAAMDAVQQLRECFDASASSLDIQEEAQRIAARVANQSNMHELVHSMSESLREEAQAGTSRLYAVVDNAAGELQQQLVDAQQARSAVQVLSAASSSALVPPRLDEANAAADATANSVATAGEVAKEVVAFQKQGSTKAVANVAASASQGSVSKVETTQTVEKIAQHHKPTVVHVPLQHQRLLLAEHTGQRMVALPHVKYADDRVYMPPHQRTHMPMAPVIQRQGYAAGTRPADMVVSQSAHSLSSVHKMQMGRCSIIGRAHHQAGIPVHTSGQAFHPAVRGGLTTIVHRVPVTMVSPQIHRVGHRGPVLCALPRQVPAPIHNGCGALHVPQPVVRGGLAPVQRVQTTMVLLHIHCMGNRAPVLGAMPRQARSFVCGQRTSSLPSDRRNATM